MGELTPRQRHDILSRLPHAGRGFLAMLDTLGLDADTFELHDAALKLAQDVALVQEVEERTVGNRRAKFGRVYAVTAEKYGIASGEAVRKRVKAILEARRALDKAA